MRTEFEFLNNLKNHFNLPKVGDDCAVFPKNDAFDYLITSDMLVEDIDFRLEWSTPKHIGHKALAVSISDVSAMGGSPDYTMLSIGVPKDLWDSDFVDRFYDGYMSLAGRLGIELIGGDVSRVPSGLTIDSTVIGSVKNGSAVLRSGAKNGDLIFLTGPLGGAAAGLGLLKEGVRASREIELWKMPLLDQQLRPNPVDGGFLCGLPCSAIDIYDGVS